MGMKWLNVKRLGRDRQKELWQAKRDTYVYYWEL